MSKLCTLILKPNVWPKLCVVLCFRGRRPSGVPQYYFSQGLQLEEGGGGGTGGRGHQNTSDLLGMGWAKRWLDHPRDYRGGQSTDRDAPSQGNAAVGDGQAALSLAWGFRCPGH